MDSHAYPAGNRAYLVTDTDHGALLVIAATVLVSWTVLCWIIRLYTREVINGPFGMDDAAVTVASVSTSLKDDMAFSQAYWIRSLDVLSRPNCCSDGRNRTWTGKVSERARSF
jgi:hypothetical protein